MTAEVNTAAVIIAALALLGGGGLAAGIVALVKLRPEVGSITVDAAQGAVIVQTTVIESLQMENRRLAERLAALEAEVASVGNLHQRIGRLENERERLRAENERLKDRVKHLEEELARLGPPQK